MLGTFSIEKYIQHSYRHVYGFIMQDINLDSFEYFIPIFCYFYVLQIFIREL